MSRTWWIIPALLLAWAPPADADDGWMVTLEAPGAIPVTAPQRDRFGFGGMPAATVYGRAHRSLLLGLRLRGGLLSDGPPPEDATLMDPAGGSFAGLSVGGRVHPLAGTGLWLDLSAGAAVTGDQTRPTFEAGAGWGTRVGPTRLGPSLRYLHIYQPASGLDHRDAGLALIGLEVAVSSRRAPDRALEIEPPPPRPIPEPPPMPAERGAPPEPGFGLDGSPYIQVLEDRIILEAHVLFDTERSRVKHAGRDVLRELIAIWERHPSWERLVIEGHADRRGPKDYNLWLSTRRAERTRDWMVRLGVASERLSVRAFGETRPRDFGNSEEAHQRNRRVEFVIIRKGEEPR